MASLEPSAFGDLLRRYRTALGLTQEELAGRAHLSVDAIGALERGTRRAPRRDTIALLAEALALSSDDRAAFSAAARRHVAIPTTSQRDATDASRWSSAPSPGYTFAQQSLSGHAFEPSTLHPSTVTLLFTDIEGSTQLLQRLGPSAYADTLEEQQRLLRAAFIAHAGREIDTQGAAFFVAFPTAGDALNAACMAQLALAAHQWPSGVPARVRMGIHTGAPFVTAQGRYVGLDVHRAARIAAAGSGGQVLLSAATRELVRHNLPEGSGLRELGEHHLKDLLQPERLYQLVLPNLQADFPPLKTSERTPHSLPTPSTPLFGREQEILDVCAVVRREDVRLVNLTGPAGVGKSRLGLRVAAELVDAFEDGVRYVQLDSVHDPALVIPTIAHILNLHEGGGDALRAYLSERSLLLLLDNFEHLVDAAPLVADLLDQCARLKVLVTSRTKLHLRRECEYAVPPLALPTTTPFPIPPIPADYLGDNAAVALFVQRAQTVRPEFALTAANMGTVAAICVRLDGLPLALELAATRIKLLPPSALLARLSRRLEVLTGGARDLPTRQQTLRATLAWSYDLLAPDEQRLFCALGAFVGGWTLEAAQAVCMPGHDPSASLLETLEGLIDKNIVQRVDHGEGEVESRFDMLATIREYAVDRLKASGNAETLQRAHAEYYLHMGELAELGLWSTGQVDWADHLERDHHNLRAALGWLHDHGAASQGLRLAVAIWRFWDLRNYLHEGRAWLDAFLAVPAADDRDSAAVRARGLALAGYTAIRQQDYETAALQLKAGLTLGREAGDRWAMIFALFGLGPLAHIEGDIERAAMYYDEELAAARELGHPRAIAYAMGDLGRFACDRGDWAQAVSFLEEALALPAAHIEQDYVADCLEDLGRAVLHQGDLTRASLLLREAMTMVQALGNQRHLVHVLESWALLATAARQTERAARLFGTAAAVRETLGTPRWPNDRQELADGMTETRALLGEEAWTSAFSAGQQLSLEEAVRETLAEKRESASR